MRTNRSIARNLLLLVVLVLITTSLFARRQQVDYKDSLTASLKVVELRDKAQGMVFTNPDSARFYAEQGLELAKEIGNLKLEAGSYRVCGTTYNIQGNYEKATSCFARALRISERMKDPEEIAKSHLNLGNTPMRLGNYEDALIHFDQARQQFETLKDDGGLAQCLSKIGVVFWYRDQLDTAAILLKRAADLEERQGEKMGAAQSRDNLGMVLRDMGRYQEAIEAHRQALEVFRAEADDFTVAICMANLSLALADAGEYEDALALNTAAQETFEKMGDRQSQAAIFIDRGDLYRKKGDLPEAVASIQKGLRISRGLGSVREELTACKYLADVETARNNANAALGYYQRYLHLNDSLTKVDQEGDMRTMARYYRGIENSVEEEMADLNGELTNLKAQLAELEKGASSTQTLLWAVGGVALLLALTLIVVLSRARKKSD